MTTYFSSSQQLIERRDVNTTSETKHAKVLVNEIEEVLKTDKMKNVRDTTKGNALTFKHKNPMNKCKASETKIYQAFLLLSKLYFALFFCIG